MLPLPELALIDLDGTLIDSVPDLTWCVNAMLRELGLPERSESAVRRWVGNGVERLVERALVDDIEGMPEADLRARAMPVFMELYAAHGAERSRVYPGVEDGLTYLADRGVRLGCVTNKAERFTLPLLEALGLRARFELVVSGDSLPERKPSPRPLLYAAEHFRVAPSACTMIGDSRSDVAAARAAGFTIVCVSYGYNHGKDIRDERPDVVIDSLADFAQVFAAG
ncbi:phosphoglycolate phosphatase [Acidihalobacter ferrooxydans]|uniref:Phosphoglycolate phosphatase n=1 Tax=Acidihalobacter ferrooxydans TaxID=1765967 RepID=A0A1P8UDB3_9GAMM|nr:phosphoglycolate phosphatase [Acidihalobacter ferrooxydans]APZ41835.1 phosphoglycolate phosphatase [Acidihalobacter ferrooxydans]